MPLAERPFAQRPHNQTIHDELKLFHIRWDGDHSHAPHMFVTTSRGDVEVKPMRDDEILTLFKQLGDILHARGLFNLGRR